MKWKSFSGFKKKKKKKVSLTLLCKRSYSLCSRFENQLCLKIFQFCLKFYNCCQKIFTVLFEDFTVLFQEFTVLFEMLLRLLEIFTTLSEDFLVWSEVRRFLQFYLKIFQFCSNILISLFVQNCWKILQFLLKDFIGF